MSQPIHMEADGGTWCGVPAPKRQRVRDEHLVTCPNCKEGLRVFKERIERERPKLPPRKAP